MARSLIVNVSGSATALPFPYRGVLKPGAGTIVEGDNVAVVAALGGAAQINGVFSVRPALASEPLSFQDGAAVPGALATKEALTFPVDYNAVGALDIPTGMTFYSQGQVDDFRKGGSFKHIQQVYNALPDYINHTITMNLAAGVHRPHPTLGGSFSAWGLDTKTHGPLGSLKLNGAPPSQYTQKSGLTYPIAITSIQAGSGDPFINVSGTPFVASALKGYYAVLNTGQTVLIHENTTSRLNVLQAISPAPTSILFIGRPSTIMRNSLNDAAHLPFNTSGALQTSTNNPAVSFVGVIQLQDVTVDPFGAHSNAFTHSYGELFCIRHVLDQDTINDFGGLPDGNGWNMPDSIFFQDCAFIDRLTNSPADGLLFCGGCFVWGCFFQNSENAIEVRQGFGLFADTVFDAIGHVDPETLGMVMVTSNGRIDLENFGGKTPEFRNGRASVPALYLADGGSTRPDFQSAIFKNNVAACVKVGTRGTFDTSQGQGSGWIDGGGNGDVGIDIVGPNAVVNLHTSTNLTGTNGDVRLGGSVVTYASIPSTGTGHLNTLSVAKRG